MRVLMARKVVIGVLAAVAIALAAPTVTADEVVLDAHGRVTKILHDDGSETRLSYDSEGRLTLVERPDGSRICSTYENGVEETFGC